ncbi:MAG: undecaprenyldiphospho-muramoylpentapeptide beta-N-acetylglucosaminyltransferase [Bacillota bacterium]|jgi:UDP-N-acetylglucosamine--N-acetylmuramyl-(pentapeptide) pyrophosphoryl-undecaprenol N-acetylglucosamine transferase|nr:undecaprenyldiphospho-muramoylpentapeptide beta-N-acetylglucosaminyltransferase [Bacillota bacterium]HHT91003.1 undecaprenyldiphospho-muramoylpentapeptide beta-N-acetylglucosaminyltransferase [Bacillota bacterium]
MKTIVLTGGGSAGHVTPHFALIPHLQEKGWDIHYIGTHDGIERELVADRLPYYPITAGKLRRYFDLKNFSDPFRVLKGVYEARRILRKLRPHLVFSKGGFVSVPVTIAAWSLRIPVVLHESDLTPGLANKLSLPFARELCLTFPDSLAYLKGKGKVTGTPIRSELTLGSKEQGLLSCGFSSDDPTLLVMGGSLGAAILNQTIRENLEVLTKRYQIIHLCGKGNLDAGIRNRRYCQLEYAQDELPHLLAAADYVLSRAGANSIFELLALAKPHILVPLSRQASRGDQILNAASFAKQGFSLVIQEEELNLETLQYNLDRLEANKEQFIQRMQESEVSDGTGNVLRIMEGIIVKKALPN